MHTQYAIMQDIAKAYVLFTTDPSGSHPKHVMLAPARGLTANVLRSRPANPSVSNNNLASPTNMPLAAYEHGRYDNIEMCKVPCFRARWHCLDIHAWQPWHLDLEGLHHILWCLPERCQRSIKSFRQGGANSFQRRHPTYNSILKEIVCVGCCCADGGNLLRPHGRQRLPR